MHSVFTWVMVLQKLQTDGRAPSDVIAAWNRQATHASHLQGLKRVSCMQIIDHFPPEALDAARKLKRACAAETFAR